MLKNVLQIYLVCVLYGILTNGDSGEEVKKIQITKWATSILQDATSVIALQTIEPGFDLSDEEIKNFKLWPKGIISYYIDEYSFDKVLRDRIRSYLDIFSGITGVHFMELPRIPKDEKARWILFLNRQGLLKCADINPENFTNDGVQRVVLGYDCISSRGELGDVALAIVGVPPQHNSPDRDKYITVKMENVIPGKEYLFNKLKNSEWLFHDLGYDFSSVSHFHYHEHSVNGKATIEPKEPADVQVGESEGLSYTDVLKVRMLYNYISKNKHSSAIAPECNKLFRPGAKFNKFRPQDDDVEPREKPNEYLVAIGKGKVEKNQTEYRNKLLKGDEVKKEDEITEDNTNQNEYEELGQDNEKQGNDNDEIIDNTEDPVKHTMPTKKPKRSSDQVMNIHGPLKRNK